MSKEFGSRFGRSPTSVAQAAQELFTENSFYNPKSFYSSDQLFLGVDHEAQEELKPIKLPSDRVTHALLVGATRTGKGVQIGNLATQHIKTKGLIIIDPKGDDFLPQILLENKREDQEIFIQDWGINFSYKVFLDEDTENEAFVKLCALLNLDDDENNSGVTYYRKNERTLLARLIKIFFQQDEYLNKSVFEKSFNGFMELVKCIFEDLNFEVLANSEIRKARPNGELLDKYAERYFLKSSLVKMDILENELETLRSLHQSLREFDFANIQNTLDIREAIHNENIIYLKMDMLSPSSMKFCKLIIADIITQARKQRGNCVIMADELSFYVTSILGAALATIAGFGVHFYIAYQDDGQLKDKNLQRAIKSNCQLKILYKTSDIETLDYIERISGKELITQETQTTTGIGSTQVSQTSEPFMSITRLRALPQAFVAVCIFEGLPHSLFLRTSPVEVSKRWNWDTKPYKITKEHYQKQYMDDKDMRNNNNLQEPQKNSSNESQKEIDDINIDIAKDDQDQGFSLGNL